MSNKLSLAGCALCLALAVGVFVLRPGDGDSPQPLPAPAADVPDLSAFFREGPKAAAKADAEEMAGLLGAMAAIVEEDGRLPEPVLTTAWRIEDMRFALRHFGLRGRSLDASYRGVGSACGEFLTQRVGEEPGPLDGSGRAAWVRALRDLADECRRVAANL
mgnify:CR=1 FL=1